MRKQPGTIAYYITAHGFGHAVRSLEIIRQLLLLDSKLKIIIVSDLPQFLVVENTGVDLPQSKRRLDIGLIQLDSIRFDLEATLAALHQLHNRHALLVRREVEFLRSEHVQGIVSDVGFLPYYAATEAGIPSLGVGNFTWDWIYHAYGDSDLRWKPLMDWIREGYGMCDIFLQLPMHGDCSACPNITKVPLVARKARLKPEETRRILGVDPGKKNFLISFASLDLLPQAQRRLETIAGTNFYYKAPLRFDFANGYSIDGLNLSYADVVAAMDGVITKPGYGIVSDCLAHGTPIIHTDRGFFPECEILVGEMERQLTTVHMSSEELYAGEWDPAIHRLESLPRRLPVLKDDGAAVCAQTILRNLVLYR